MGEAEGDQGEGEIGREKRGEEGEERGVGREVKSGDGGGRWGRRGERETDSS